MRIRAYGSGDFPALAELFYHTVHSVCARDYTGEQLDAWADGRPDPAAWDASLRAHTSLVAEEGGRILGFGDMDESGYLDRLYVHRDFQRRGVGTALCGELERRVGTGRYTTYASLTARPFFLARGYRTLREQTVERHGVALVNFVMEKGGEGDAGDDWFRIEALDRDSFAISEYRHWEEPHCYLLRGRERSLLIDTGLGVGNLRRQAEKLTAGPVTAVLTHAHWDHMGGLGWFPEFYLHGAEENWLTGDFPLPTAAVRAQLTRDCLLPPDFDPEAWTLFRGRPAGLLADGEELDLGGRRVRVLHTPGHSPGHLCFWEEERGWLFTGDMVYRGTLFADYPSTDPEAYLTSLERLAELPVRRVLPGHHSLDLSPGLVREQRDALRELKAADKLRHGAGTFTHGDWAIRL